MFTPHGGQGSFWLRVGCFYCPHNSSCFKQMELWWVVSSEGHRRDLLETSLPKCNANSCREGKKWGEKAPLEFTHKHDAVKPGVIISQQCLGPLSGLTALGLQAALLNVAADLLRMLNRHTAIICQQYNSSLLPSGLQTHMLMCGFHERWSFPASGSRGLPMSVFTTESLDDERTLERSNCPSQSPLNLVADVIAIFF